MPDYYESAENVQITKKRALLELDRHAVPQSEHAAFYSELGNRETYDAQAVLLFLGY